MVRGAPVFEPFNPVVHKYQCKSCDTTEAQQDQVGHREDHTCEDRTVGNSETGLPSSDTATVVRLTSERLYNESGTSDSNRVESDTDFEKRKNKEKIKNEKQRKNYTVVGNQKCEQKEKKENQRKNHTVVEEPQREEDIQLLTVDEAMALQEKTQQSKTAEYSYDNPVYFNSMLHSVQEIEELEVGYAENADKTTQSEQDLIDQEIRDIKQAFTDSLKQITSFQTRTSLDWSTFFLKTLLPLVRRTHQQELASLNQLSVYLRRTQK